AERKGQGARGSHAPSVTARVGGPERRAGHAAGRSWQQRAGPQSHCQPHVNNSPVRQPPI
ncbi:hypothetical protein LPJ70_004644, partial [Coemansia sp. RSA 2708]